MTITFPTSFPWYGGGHTDPDAENHSALVSGITVVRDTTVFQTGAACNKFPMATAAQKNIHPLANESLAGKAGVLFNLGLRLSADPTVEMCILSNWATVDNTVKLLRTDATRRIKFFDYLGNPIGACSPFQIPTASWADLQIVFDISTLPTVFISVAFNGIWQMAFDTGRTPEQYFGPSPAISVGVGEWYSGSGKGADLFVDDAGIMFLAAADLPHVFQHGRYRLSEPQTPTTAATYSAWNDGSGSPAAGTPADIVDDDGDTRYWAELTASAKNSVTSTDANPMGVSDTVVAVQHKGVFKLGGAAKAPAMFLWRTASTGEETKNIAVPPGTTYVGCCKGPTVGAYTRGDFSSFEWGAQQPTTSVGCRVTMLLGPEAIYYSSLLPLAPRPHPYSISR